MTSRIEALKAKLKKDKEKSAQGKAPSKYFRFWDVEVGESSKFRFLPDANVDNPDYYFVEEMMYDWTFDDPDNRGKSVNIKMPCRNMYTPASCSVWGVISELFNQNDPRASKLWVKRNYLAQGFVRSTPLVEDPAPEKKIRYVTMSRDLKDIQTAKISETDPDRALPYADPIDYENGVDFTFTKTKKPNGYNDYSTSAFINRSTPLTQEEIDAIEEEGLIDLRELLPKEPSEEAWRVQEQMLEAFLNDEPWNVEWETHFRPWKEANKNGGDTTDTTAGTKPNAKMADDLPVKEEADAPAPVDETPAEKPASSGSSPQDMLARIKARAK